MDIVLPVDAFGILAYTFFVIAATLTCYWFLGKKDSPDDTKWAIVWVFWGAMFVFCVLVVANYVMGAETVKKDIYNKFVLVPKENAAHDCPYLFSNIGFDLNATLNANKPF